MIFTFEETPDSRQETSNPPSYELVYKAVGEHDDATVHAYALAATPSVVFRPTGSLYRKDVVREPDGWGQYTVRVPYGPLDSSSLPAGSYTFDFDTTGATVKIKAAKAHVNAYTSSGATAADLHKGSIGVKSDGEVEGADIVIPALKLTYTFKHPSGVVDEAFARNIAAVTGRTNLNPFRGFAGEELLFIGGTGSDGTDSEAAVAYQFVASANESSLSIGDITGIVKKGHHYAWVEFKDEVDGGKAVRQPERVNIERVYDPVDFATVLGWS